MKPDKISRRKFVGTTAAAAASFAIVPSHVIAGSGKTPPSDKLVIANIGCGTQGLREMSGMLTNEKIHISSVCDVNKYTEDYLDWSPNGIRDSIRKTIADDTWGSGIKGIPGGRDVGKEYVEKYYAKNKPSKKYKGCNSYEDFRELLENETDLDAVKIMTPDHTHAAIAMAAMKKGKHIITHKPISNRMKEAMAVIDLAKSIQVKTHLVAWSHRPEYGLMLKWYQDGVIGDLKEIHNWSFRPVWPQYTKVPTEKPNIPDGFNWELWLGPEKDRSYHPYYTHNSFRGWYDFGGGSMADMGHYSLFPFFKTFGITKAPVSAKAYGSTSSEAVDQVCRRVKNDAAYPGSCTFRLQFPKQEKLPAFNLYWYDGGMKPFEPEELLEDGREIAPEGLMLVGTKGKILGGFRGENPEIIPNSKKESYEGTKNMPSDSIKDRKWDIWVDKMLNGKDTPGDFISAQCVTETINLATVALRAGRKVDYDSANIKITNVDEANQYLVRDYRAGWEL